MRLVQVTIPAGRREAVLAALDEEGVDYVVTEETSGREFTAVVYFPLPPEAVEPVLDSLQEAGLGEDAYTVVVDAETVVSRRFEKLKERYEEEDGDDRVARQELVARAEDLVPTRVRYVLLTVASVLVATAGVLMDSPAVVVGSMVIAPLVGPALMTPVGSVLDDRDLFARGVKLQLVGGVLSIATAAVFAWLVRVALLVPPGTDLMSISQVAERAAPGVLSLVVALGAGVAGGLSLAATVSASIVGVAIAVALVPPTAVIGIALAWGELRLAAGAFVLVLVNFLSINAGAMATLWYEGYRPEQWVRTGQARAATVRRVAILVAAIAVLSLFLGGVTISSVQASTFEDTAREEAEAALADTPLSLLSVNVEYGDEVVFRQPERVVVVVGRPSAREYSEVDEEIRDQIRRETGREVTVEVRFVEVETAGDGSGRGTTTDGTAARVRGAGPACSGHCTLR